MSIPTEEQHNRDEAAEIIADLREMDGRPAMIGVFNSEQQIEFEVDRNLAIAMAERLLSLAQSLPDSPRILRRASDVDTHLRALDG